jgi:transcriptional regulator with XRE-family HTH domain
MTPDQPFGHWLRSELRLHRLSLRQVAERSGVSHSTLSRLLRGRQPSLSTAARIARALGQPEAGVAAMAGLDAPLRRESDVLSRVERALRADPTARCGASASRSPSKGPGRGASSGVRRPPVRTEDPDHRRLIA